MDSLRKVALVLTVVSLVLLLGSTLFMGQAVAIADDMPLGEGMGPLLFPPQGEYVPDQIIVKFKAGVLDAEIEQLNQDLETKLIYTSPFAGFKVLQIPEGKTVADMVEVYSRHPFVENAQPNYIYYATWSPNDPAYSYQWHFDAINLEAAWDLDTTTPNYGGDPSIVVAVIDSGVAYETYGGYVQAPDLANTNFTSGWDFVNGEAHPNDDQGHGTHVCGTIAQSTNNGVGVAGIAFNTTIMPVKVMEPVWVYSGGWIWTATGTTADIVDGIIYATDNGADVINLSLGGSSPDTTLENAVAYAYNNGAVVIASSGNSGDTTPNYPASYDSYVISVGATRYDNTRSYYSSYGSHLDMVAPGGDASVDQNSDGYADGVLQLTLTEPTYPNSVDPSSFTYYFWQGTSMAAPHVAGVAALILAKHPSWTPDQVRYALESSATDLGTAGWDQYYGWGLLNAHAAVGSAGGPPTGDDEIGIWRGSNRYFYLDTNGNGILNIATELGPFPNSVDSSDVPVAGDWNGDGTDEIGIWRGSNRYFYLDTDGDGLLTNFATERFGPFPNSVDSSDVPVAGDWNGDGTDEIGIWRGSNRYFYLDTDGDGLLTNFATERFGPFPNSVDSSDVPVAGDWNGDGTDEIGIWRGSNRYFYLDTDGDGLLTNFATERFGPFPDSVDSSDVPIAGDWNNDGTDEIGIWRGSNHYFYLDTNGNGILNIATERFGPFPDSANPSDVSVAGDWNGDGTDEIGIWRGSNRYFYLDTSSANEIFGPFPNSADPSDVPVVGDWNGDGTDEIGIWRGSNRYFYLDTNGDGLLTNFATERFGPFPDSADPSDVPIAGDWNGDGTDEIGIWRGSNRYFYLDTNGNGILNIATERFGPFPNSVDSSDVPVAGDWNGDGTDEIGIWRGSNRYFYLDTNGDGLLTNFATERFGPFPNSVDPSDVPVAGDWNGDGTDEIGIWRGSNRYFYLDTDGDGLLTNFATERFGPFPNSVDPSDVPIAGNWDGQ
jgi:serine protease